MIIKTLSRKSNSGQLVNYIFKYVFREQDKKIGKGEPSKNDKSKFIIRHNIRSRSLKGIIKEYKENESYRIVHRKDSVKLFHTILSFSNKDKDKIDDNLLKDVAKKFIEERGLNNLYAGTKHEDKDHIHLHIAISGTQLNGYSSRVSKQRLHSIKLALDGYQREKYPQLKHSLPEHGKGRRLAKEAIVERVKDERQTNKQGLIECVEKAWSGSKSEKDFVAKIAEQGHQPYFRNGVLQGVRFEGQTKYRFSNLGFDKSRLQTFGQGKVAQDKTLAELQNLRTSRTKEKKRTIEEPAFKRSSQAILDKDEQKIMSELSDLRGEREGREITLNDDNEGQSIGAQDEEINDKDNESRESVFEENPEGTEDIENSTDEFE